MIEDKNAEEEINALLTDLWQRHLPAMRERLGILDNAALNAATGRLTGTQQAEAQSVAHKLAGNLGMFGHAEAGSLASEMEQIFKQSDDDGFEKLPALARRLRQQLSSYL
jgi:chemotaxis protein histidine kinase CheA